ncbi:YslB family protein [Rossellomorea aquimaris]|uniref:YslB family protein n=1 Tax=Rossellomorea aquimaris TaxID=189382 RepID=UPI0007D05F16|nr:YslB family protein [Rossellomorea aquimaris]
MEQKKEEIHQESVPIFGYELLRDMLIPDILGKHSPDILYWGGKQLSRRFPLQTTEELISFFNEAGWGTLNVIEQKKNEMTFEMNGPLVERRLSLKSDVTFKLEAGFLAEQIQFQKKCVTEATDEIHKRSKSVRILTRWDDKDRIE